MRKIYTPTEFRAAARRKDADIENCIVRVALRTERAFESEQSRRIRFTITDDSIDRIGDKILADGWDLEAYKQNPVVLWAHDSVSLPVAKSVEIWREGNALKSVAEFATPDLSQFADRVYKMLREGFLSAVSVGFNPTKWAWSEDKDRPFGIEFIEQELLEYSIVPVPANAGALIDGKDLDVEAISRQVAGWEPYGAEIEALSRS